MDAWTSCLYADDETQDHQRLILGRGESGSLVEEALLKIEAARQESDITHIYLCHGDLFRSDIILEATKDLVADTFEERPWEAITLAQCLTTPKLDTPAAAALLFAPASVEQSNRMMSLREMLVLRLGGGSDHLLELEHPKSGVSTAGSVLCMIQSERLLFKKSSSLI